MSGKRINVYIPEGISLRDMDKFIKLRGFFSRSEYIRTLIREDMKRNR